MSRIRRLATIATTAALTVAGTAAAGAVPSASHTGTTEVSVAAAPAVSTRPATRWVDVDGDGRRDLVKVSLFNNRKYHQTFMLTVRTSRATASIPVVIAHEFGHRYAPSRILRGTAPVDGVAGHDILIDYTAETMDWAWLKTYTWRDGKIVQLRSPSTSGTDGSWRALYPFWGSDSYAFSTKEGKRYVTHTALRRSKSGRYYGPATTFVWAGGGWVKKNVRNISGVTERQADRMPLWSGIVWR